MTHTLSEALAVARGEEVVLSDPRHDAAAVIRPVRARSFTIADELGPRQPLPQAEPVDETWPRLLAAFGCAVVLFAAIGMTLVVIGGMRP